MSTQRLTQLLGAGHFRQNKRTNSKIKSRSKKKRMTPEEKKELTEHINAISKIIYRQAKPKQVQALAKFEQTVREQML